MTSNKAATIVVRDWLWYFMLGVIVGVGVVGIGIEWSTWGFP